MKRTKEERLIEEIFGQPLLSEGNPLLDDTSDGELSEKSPPGWENVVEKMKGNQKIKDPFALAWAMHDKGYKPKK